MEYPFKDLMPLDEVLEREGYYKDWTHLDPEVFYSLTQISEYIKTKGYGVDVRLLIAQLAEHFGLKTTQVVDLANLLSTKHDALKDQFDVVIRDATSGADWGGEIALARGGKATLGERLDETTARLAHIAHDVTQYITDNDRTGVMAAINKAKDGDRIFFPSRSTPYDIGVIETNKKLTFESNGIINGTIKPLKDTCFLGLTFKNVSKGIDVSEMNGLLCVENCSFENVDYPIEGVGQELGVMESVKLIGNVFNNTVSPVQIRNKRINDLTVENNVVKNITTSTRFAVGFRLGTDNDIGQTLDDLYIKNVLFSGNTLSNILNTGTGSDWEAGGIQAFAENIIIKDNHFNDIERTGNADCEAVYSKGYNILVENNIFNNAGGDEGTVVLKRNGLEEAGTSRVQNNLFIKKKKNTTYNEIGVLLSMSNVVVTNNTFINYTRGVETYGLGAEGLSVKNNEFINLDSGVYNRVTDVRVLEDNLIMSGNVLRHTKNILTTTTVFKTNGKLTIENNVIEKAQGTVFSLKGVIKKLIIKGNEINTTNNDNTFIIEKNISHPNGIEMIISDNLIDELNGRVLVGLNANTQYNYVEINNNSVVSADRGFSVNGSIIRMVAMNNNISNITEFPLVASPNSYLRLNNYPLEDILPQ